MPRSRSSSSPFALAVVLVVVGVGGCRCGPSPGDDAGPGEGEGEGAGAEGEGAAEGEGETPPLDAGPQCTESTEHFGEDCGDCGTFVCSLIDDALVCNDPGLNPCGVCSVDSDGDGIVDFDQSAGRVGEPCGVELCGIGRCNDDGTASECFNGDLLRNECGGCAQLPLDVHPGDVCSGCGTGEQTCTTDLDSMVCYRGRESDNQCAINGTTADVCDRCVLFHADMVDHVAGGGYLNPGTTALIEDTGGGTAPSLIFDPLVEGPGACCLPTGEVFVSSDPNPFAGESYALVPDFSSSLNLVLSDPVRVYSVPSFVLTELQTGQLRFIVLADNSFPQLFQDPVFSVGDVVVGPP